MLAGAGRHVAARHSWTFDSLSREEYEDHDGGRRSPAWAPAVGARIVAVVAILGILAPGCSVLTRPHGHLVAWVLIAAYATVVAFLRLVRRIEEQRAENLAA